MHHCAAAVTLRYPHGGGGKIAFVFLIRARRGQQPQVKISGKRKGYDDYREANAVACGKVRRLSQLGLDKCAVTLTLSQ